MEVPGAEDEVAAVPKTDCPDETNVEEVVLVAFDPKIELFGEEDAAKGDCPKELLEPNTEVDEEVVADGPPKMEG